MFRWVGINKLSVSPQVSIVWPDKHTSVFDAEWLKKRCFSAAARQALQEDLFLNGEASFYILPLYWKAMKQTNSFSSLLLWKSVFSTKTIIFPQINLSQVVIVPKPSHNITTASSRPRNLKGHPFLGAAQLLKCLVSTKLFELW